MLILFFGGFVGGLAEVVGFFLFCFFFGVFFVCLFVFFFLLLFFLVIFNEAFSRLRQKLSEQPITIPPKSTPTTKAPCITRSAFRSLFYFSSCLHNWVVHIRLASWKAIHGSPKGKHWLMRHLPAESPMIFFSFFFFFLAVP